MSQLRLEILPHGEVLLHRPRPSECTACEYDRKFPETASGGWIYMGNNGPYVECWCCNPYGAHQRD